MLKTTIGFIEMNTMYFHILTITIIYIGNVLFNNCIIDLKNDVFKITLR